MMQKRPIVVDGDIAYVPLTRGLVAVIDAEDVHLVEGWNWSVLTVRSGLRYARRNMVRVGVPQKTILLHRVVMRAKDSDLSIDHKNGDGLDCRKSNLRFASQQQNCFNSRPRQSATGVKGVRKHSLCNKFTSSIGIDGKSYYLGIFDTIELAQAAYAAASARLHREFGRTE